MSLLSEILRDSNIKKASWKAKFIALVIAAGFGGSGWLISTQFINPYRESREAKNWVASDAVVEKSKLISNNNDVDIDFEYRYEFNGNLYLNNQFKLAEKDTKISKKSCEKRVTNYPKGHAMTIWLNPRNPQQSLVNRQLTTENWISLLGSIPFFSVAFCALIYLLFNGVAFRIQKREWQKAAQIANRQSAHKISEYLSDENLNEREYVDINFLKRERLLGAFAYAFMILFANGILSVFILLGIAAFLNGGNILWLTFVIPLLILFFYFISQFFSHLFSSKGDDYVIISEWDFEYDKVQHSWLLLTDPRDASELGITTSTDSKSRKLKSLLDNKNFKDCYKTPNKSIITGSLTQSINGSLEKEINLLIYTRSKRSKKYKKHRIPIYTPDND